MTHYTTNARHELHTLHATLLAEGRVDQAHDCQLVLDRGPGWKRARRRVERELDERALGIHIDRPIEYDAYEDHDA